MKTIAIWIAKLIVLGFWGGVIYFSFIHPLPGKMSSLLPAFAVLVLFVHGIQAVMLNLIAKGLITLKHRQKFIKKLQAAALYCVIGGRH